jgi:arylsulfatase A-like enzyme
MPKKSARRRKPNILIFMMDTQGTRNMSCYGYRLKTTPNIDKIAKEGAIFLNHFGTDAWTLPVHASMFTGRYVSGHGAGAQHEGLEPGLPQMGEVFTRNGYRSIAYSVNPWAYDGNSRISAGTGFQDYIEYDLPKYRAVPPYIPSKDPDKKDKGSFKVVGMAKDWIDRNIMGGNKPFIMFINCLEPHDPYKPPEPFRSQFKMSGVPYKKTINSLGGQKESTYGDRCQTIDEWMAERCLYDGSTACLDHRIGKLADELKARGIYDDTIFIVVGDHGDVQGEQVKYAYHAQCGVWDRVCQIPLIIRYPKVFKPGTRCKELVQITDLFPALMEMAGIKDKKAEKSIQGISLLKALKRPVREFALIEAQRGMHPIRGAMCSVTDDRTDFDPRYMNVWYKAARTKKYKYIWVSNGNDMLFDIKKDPDERWNIIADYPGTARKLRRMIEKQLMSMELRYYSDMFSTPHRYNPFGLRRMAAWGFFQPLGVVPPWDPKVLPKWMKKGYGNV